MMRSQKESEIGPFSLDDAFDEDEILINTYGSAATSQPILSPKSNRSEKHSSSALPQTSSLFQQLKSSSIGSDSQSSARPSGSKQPSALQTVNLTDSETGRDGADEPLVNGGHSNHPLQGILRRPQSLATKGEEVEEEVDELDDILVTPSNGIAGTKFMRDFGQKINSVSRSSTDSQLLMAGEDFDTKDFYAQGKKWWQHPKLLQNKKVTCGSILLTLLGAVLIVVGVGELSSGSTGAINGWVFLLFGAVCFIPGIYHTVYITCALCGRRGYDFQSLPTFR